MVHTHVQNFWWCTYLPSFLLWDLLIEHIHSTIPIELLHIALLYRINAAADYQCCQLQTTSFKMYESQFSKTRKKRKIKNSIFPLFDQLSKVGNTAILSECGTKLLLFYKFFLVVILLQFLVLTRFFQLQNAHLTKLVFSGIIGPISNWWCDVISISLCKIDAQLQGD